MIRRGRTAWRRMRAFSYNCDCAEFYIDTVFTSTTVGEWDADITFRFDLTTLIEDGELANIEEWFGF